MSIEKTNPEQIHLFATLSAFDDIVMFRVMRYWVDEDGKRHRAIGKLEWKEIESGLFENVYDSASFFVSRPHFESFAQETSSIAKPYKEVFDSDATRSRDEHIKSLRDSIGVIERMFKGKPCTD